MNTHSKERVIVGLSGGVDSAVAALLLKQQGYRVEGLFMKNWEEEDSDIYCSSMKDIQDAQSVCDTLSIPLHTANFSEEYWKDVFEHCLTEYRSGRTPNPDILCNREIKFKAFLNHALKLGADYIATGHYAKIIKNETHFELHKARDAHKDQSYFLFMLNQFALSKAIFPICDIEKSMVRKLALEAGFQNHAKKDSTGICFIGERKFRSFLKQYIPAQPGSIETPEKKIIGRHEGLMFYTLGQRQGLGIGGQSQFEDAPWYVVGKDLDRNVLIVAQGEEHALLYSQTLLASHCHWITGEPIQKEFPCVAKIRYRQSDQNCLVQIQPDGNTQVHFEKPQRAVTPGQSVVFYQNQHCLGGGIIV